MNEQPGNDPLLLPHDADGIKELDNNLPRWWVWLFYLTTLFGAGYLLVYHVFNLAPLSAAEYKAENAAGEALKSASQARFESTIDNLEPSKDAAILAKGQRTFATYCAPCHRADGGGLVGPNLTDDYWIHGARFADNLKVIINGVPDKGMLTWKGVLQPADIHAVASYIFTLRGTHPPNPKPPENQVPAVPKESFE